MSDLKAQRQMTSEWQNRQYELMATEMKRRNDEAKTQIIELERVRQEAADDRLAARQEADVRFQAEAMERIRIAELSRRKAEKRHQAAEALRRVPKMEMGEDITNFLSSRWRLLYSQRKCGEGMCLIVGPKGHFVLRSS